MRLVDVDELIEYFDGDLEGYDNREYILHMLDSKGRSARVEAIPIEFIKKEMESSRYIWSNSGVKTELYWRGVYQGLMVLIRNWEKENENI